MTDLLLQVGVSNLVLSLPIAIAAWVVQARGRQPLLAHLLWLLVLAKLVTPPLFTLPVVALPTEALPAAAAPVASAAATTIPVPPSAAAATWTARIEDALVALWIAGSAVVLVWSLLRIARFDRLLRTASAPAPTEIQAMVTDLARRLRLRRTPVIRTTDAHLSPMVWWTGGRVHVYLPAALPDTMPTDELRWVLAHELGHVRRRDHVVRWLEWLACVAFWWNPIAWWARRNLRANEEICCDALVLETLQPEPHTYANSLLTVVEFLAAPALRPPAVASPIHSGGGLERRFMMIVSANPLRATPRWLQACILLGATGLLPIGVAYAQNPDWDAVKGRLNSAVKAGEITDKHADAMLKALKKKAGPDLDAVGVRLRKAVAAGEITAEQARAMLGALRARQKDTSLPPGNYDVNLRMKQLRSRLGDSVESGKMSKEEARARYDRLLQRYRDDKDGIYQWLDVTEDLKGRYEVKARISDDFQAAVKERVKRAIEAGDLYEAKRYQDLMKKKHSRYEGEQKAYDDFGSQVKKKVRAGKVQIGVDARGFSGEARQKTDLRLEKSATFEAELKERLRRGLEAGKISEDEAAAKFKAVMKQRALDEKAEKKARRGVLR